MEHDRAWLFAEVPSVPGVPVGWPITEAAVRYGVSRQMVNNWRRRYEADGITGLEEVSRRPYRSPHRVTAQVEAAICELQRAHPRWGARRIAGTAHPHTPTLIDNATGCGHTHVAEMNQQVGDNLNRMISELEDGQVEREAAGAG
ncbi:helix-turn-helix domain-containing protein [Streptomyces halobius]|uniref:Helix-turn-helix domain-containing protein n=1 Tax=Streptomyces halobius TaxID=2879846 RepID=A0ABY4M0H3_9ACTN|nr:helix-turn-helix domain-containing protein [Streptomyces halobius]UQA90628.1 helix-turn-helix domain-containing protein [Streptomyces halobius]